MSQCCELTIRFPEGLEPSEELRQIAREAAEAALRDVAGLQGKRSTGGLRAVLAGGA